MKIDKIIPILLLIFLVTLSNGCGYGKKRRTNRKTEIKKFTITEVRSKTISSDSKKENYAKFMHSQFPKFHESSLTEQERYINMKADLMIYLINGGTLNKWLKLRKVDREHWEFLDSYYKLDPMVKNAVEKRVKAFVVGK